MKILSRLVAKLNGVDYQIKDKWFAWSAYEENINDDNLIPYWDKDGNYIRYAVGDVVPVRKVGNRVALYKIVDYKRPYGDYAGFDDGRKYTLEFYKFK